MLDSLSTWQDMLEPVRSLLGDDDPAPKPPEGLGRALDHVSIASHHGDFTGQHYVRGRTGCRTSTWSPSR